MSAEQHLIVRIFMCGLFAWLLAICWPAGPAAAQGSPFCLPGQVFQNGFCVNPTPNPPNNPPACPDGWGPAAFGPQTACAGLPPSAAQSQALATTQSTLVAQAMDSTLDAVKKRREEESQPRSRPVQNYAPEEAYAADKVFSRLVKKAPVAPAVDPVRPGVWFQLFGSREDRKEFTQPGLPQLNGVPGVLLPPQGPNQNLSLSTDLSRVTDTGGFLGGADVTFRGVTGYSSALLVGLLAGYQSTHVRYKTSENTADIDGSSIGGYVAYVHGGFSTDVVAKVDLLRQDQAFSNFPGTVFATSGTSSVDLVNYSLAWNVNYRIPVSYSWFVEPTAGVLFTRADYDDAAALAIGLTDSKATRLQGGIRVGSNWQLASVNMYTTLTGLAYETVAFSGGATIQNGFAGTTVPNDKGKVFGQFLLANIFDFGRGFSLQAEGDVRFRSGVLGVGARGGFRYQW